MNNSFDKENQIQNDLNDEDNEIEDEFKQTKMSKSKAEHLNEDVNGIDHDDENERNSEKGENLENSFDQDNQDDDDYNEEIYGRQKGPKKV